MFTKADKQFLKETFAVKDDLKSLATKDELKSLRSEIKQMFIENNKQLLKDIADYLQGEIIKILSSHERRIDRLEKSVGGFPPITS